MSEKIGGVVGYNVRFDDKTDYNSTRIKFMTDGILIREMMTDPLLKRYSVVIVKSKKKNYLKKFIKIKYNKNKNQKILF